MFYKSKREVKMMRAFLWAKDGHKLGFLVTGVGRAAKYLSGMRSRGYFGGGRG